MNDRYYAIGSFEKDGKIIFEHHLWNDKEQAEKVLKNPIQMKITNFAEDSLLKVLMKEGL